MHYLQLNFKNKYIRMILSYTWQIPGNLTKDENKTRIWIGKKFWKFLEVFGSFWQVFDKFCQTFGKMVKFIFVLIIIVTKHTLQCIPNYLMILNSTPLLHSHWMIVKLVSIYYTHCTYIEGMTLYDKKKVTTMEIVILLCKCKSYIEMFKMWMG